MKDTEKKEIETVELELNSLWEKINFTQDISSLKADILLTLDKASRDLYHIRKGK